MTTGKTATARHREERPVDMVPASLRIATKSAVNAIGARYVSRPLQDERGRLLNETGKLEWLYRDDARHGAHDATPTIDEIAETEPCEKTTGWPATSCATRGDLRVTAEDWSSGYCLPCLVRAARRREQTRPRRDLYNPWPAAAVEVLRDWIVQNTRYGNPTDIRVSLNIDDGVRRAELTFTEVRGRWDLGTVDITMPWAVAAKAHYIATGERAW